MFTIPEALDPITNSQGGASVVVEDVNQSDSGGDIPTLSVAPDFSSTPSAGAFELGECQWWPARDLD